MVFFINNIGISHSNEMPSAIYTSNHVEHLWSPARRRLPWSRCTLHFPCACDKHYLCRPHVAVEPRSHHERRLSINLANDDSRENNVRVPSPIVDRLRRRTAAAPVVAVYHGETVAHKSRFMLNRLRCACSSVCR